MVKRMRLLCAGDLLQEQDVFLTCKATSMTKMAHGTQIVPADVAAANKVSQPSHVIGLEVCDRAKLLEVCAEASNPGED